MVNTHKYGRWALAGTFLLLLGSPALSQEKLKEAGKQADERETMQQPRYRSLVRSGYTRPGSPADKIGKKGDILQAALEADPTGHMIGATVYFAVFKSTGAQDDLFGTEMAGMIDSFTSGHSFENSVSPHLDRKAKYLYLYQIVNDRGLNPVKDGILPAVDGHINTADISSFALRLTVDPRYITSWGHFSNLGFEAKVKDRKVSKDGIVGAAEDTQILPMAISSNPAVVRELPHLRFQENAPAYGLGNLINYFGLDKSNLNLQTSAHASLLSKKGKEINWVASGLEMAMNGGRQPDFVQIVMNNYKENTEPTLEGRYIGDMVFRVDFKKGNAVKVGQHSVVFGFTSDLPPTDEPLRVEGAMPNFAQGEMKAKDGKEIKEAGLGSAASGVGAAVAAALGTAPMPAGGGGAVGGGGMTSGLLGGGTMGGVGGFGGAFLPTPGSLFGTARAPASASGSGSGNGQGANQGQQSQAQLTPNANTVNFNATLINQQAQQQAQAQFQIQAQAQLQFNRNNNHNNHHRNHHNHVVPEPSAVVLGLIGLPALFLYRRRCRAQEAAIS